MHLEAIMPFLIIRFCEIQSNIYPINNLHELYKSSLSSAPFSSIVNIITMPNMNTLVGKKLKLILELLSISCLLVILLHSTRSFKIIFAKKNAHIPSLHIHKHIQVAHSTCEGTLYPELCVSTLSSFPDLTSKSVPQIICSVINHTVLEVKSSASNCSGIKKNLKNLDTLETRALNSCIDLLDATIDELKAAESDLSKNKSASKNLADIQTLFSAAITDQYTCLAGFANSKKNVRKKIEKRLYNISRHVSNALAMLKKIPGGKRKLNSQENFQEYGEIKNGFPAWLSSKDRKLVQTSVNQTKFNLIVAKDGSGNFTTINAAVAAAPNSSATRFVIYIKAGAYFENVEVDKKKTNLMFLGDGIGKTLVKGNRNNVDGWPTFDTGTVVLEGTGFIAKGITFENYAGPEKHQAVALRSSADFSAFYQCSFVAYQDTLYVHKLRQFYRECDVYGTIDFIFGNAAVVLQNCNLYARKPNENQKNVLTAQGRTDPNQSTGISILNCKVAAASDLIPVQSSFKTYLGRPWKEYSRTVFMKSYIDDLIEPAGWLEWNGTKGLDTLYYGEYMNRGPGSNISARIKWPGYRIINNSAEASQFTVGPFIQGKEWLDATGVPYFDNLG